MANIRSLTMSCGISAHRGWVILLDAIGSHFSSSLVRMLKRPAKVSKRIFKVNHSLQLCFLVGYLNIVCKVHRIYENPRYTDKPWNITGLSSDSPGLIYHSDPCYFKINFIFVWKDHINEGKIEGHMYDALSAYGEYFLSHIVLRPPITLPSFKANLRILVFGHFE